ncbi:MAG: hypothetical protein BWY85_00068 [Firmicutes bacterium ADurb.Bin506]|nr:MAG: hypothetical protein BWY85_00068 [Firmicutes bacterium ADurb.Bin506]
MPAQLAPPDKLDHLRYFVVRLDRDTQRYELIEPGKAQTYDLGDAFAARRYLEAAAGEYLGGRALDSATAFGASQAIPKERRAFGLDLTKVNLDAGIIRADRDLDAERLLGQEFFEEKVLIV